MSKDTIYREDAIKVTWQEPSYTDAINALTEVRERIKSIPSVEKQGEWILECDAEGEGDNLYRCSECGQRCGCQEYDIPNFCPNCGARMFDKDIDVPYKIASDQRDYDSTYEPTYNEQDGSM